MNEPVPLMSAVEAAQEAEIARLRAALAIVRDTHENSRKAASKGSRPYDAAFLWACYGHEVDAALEDP